MLAEIRIEGGMIVLKSPNGKEIRTSHMPTVDEFSQFVSEVDTSNTKNDTNIGNIMQLKREGFETEEIIEMYKTGVLK